MFIHMYTIARKLEGLRGVLLICQHEMKFIKYVSNVAVTNDLLSQKKKRKEYCVSYIYLVSTTNASLYVPFK